MFSRTLGGEQLLVVVNMRPAQDNIVLPVEWRGRSCTDLMENEEMKLGSSLTLMPFEYLILK